MADGAGPFRRRLARHSKCLPQRPDARFDPLGVPDGLRAEPDDAPSASTPAVRLADPRHAHR